MRITANLLHFIPRLRPYFGKRELFALIETTADAESELTTFLAKTTGCPHVFLFSYARSALFAFLKANCPQPTSIVTPAFNCTAVPYAILKAGHSIKWVDVQSHDANLSLPSLQNTAAAKEDLLLITHMYGNTSPAAPATSWAQANGIRFTLADAALALYSYDEGAHVASRVDGAILSFSTGKHLSTIEGGAFVTRHADIAGRIEEWCAENLSPAGPMAAVRKALFLCAIYLTYQGRLYPAADFLFHSTPLLNGLMSGVRSSKPELPHDALSQMSHLQARIGRAQIRRAEEIRGRRLQLQKRYLAEFGDFILTNHESQANCLSHISIRVRDRDRLIADAKKLGINIDGPLYDYNLASLPQLQSEGFRALEAERLAHEIVNLPFYPGLENSDLQRIFEFLHRSRSEHLISLERV